MISASRKSNVFVLDFRFGARINEISHVPLQTVRFLVFKDISLGLVGFYVFVMFPILLEIDFYGIFLWTVLCIIVKMFILQKISIMIVT